MNPLNVTYKGELGDSFYAGIKTGRARREIGRGGDYTRIEEKSKTEVPLDSRQN